MKQDLDQHDGATATAAGERCDHAKAAPTDAAAILWVDLTGRLTAGLCDHTAGETTPAIVVGRRRAMERLVVGNARAVLLDTGSFVERPAAKFPRLRQLVVVLPARLRERELRVVAQCASLAARHASCTVVIVSTYRVHFGDATTRERERRACEVFAGATGRQPFVVRPGELVDTTVDKSRWRRLLACLYPAMPPSLRTCRVEVARLCAAIDKIVAAHTGPLKPRVPRSALTILGENRRLCDVLADEADASWPGRCVVGVARLLRWLLVGHLLAALVRAAARFHAPLGRWWCHTLEPTSVDELLSLYHPWNAAHVVIAGYNTGVTHFGWRFAGKTVVKTTGCARRVRIGASHVDVDAGTTLKRLCGSLADAGRELYVMPNYSYVSVGTAVRADPRVGQRGVDAGRNDRTRVAVRRRGRTAWSRRGGDGRFERYMYDAQGGVVALRLRLRVREDELRRRRHGVGSAFGRRRLADVCRHGRLEHRIAQEPGLGDNGRRAKYYALEADASGEYVGSQ
ncbi:MAG: hypothetical protein R3C10_02780 [Pirellulales bacterium]